MNRFAGSCVSIGISMALVLGTSGTSRAQGAGEELDDASATCAQMSTRISQLIGSGDAIVAQNREDQQMHGTDPSALVNRAANLGMAETDSDEANTIARLLSSRRCSSQAGPAVCGSYSSRILQLDSDAKSLIEDNRTDQSLRNPAALINRVANMFIAQKESTDANTLAILSAQGGCLSTASAECNAANGKVQQLSADADRLMDNNSKDQEMGRKRMFLVISVPDPSALINRMSNISIAQSEAEEANTYAITASAASGLGCRG